jgi:hypothetical protein
MLPFTLEPFLNVFETYNKAIWPTQKCAGAQRSLRSRPKRSRRRRSGAFIRPRASIAHGAVMRGTAGKRSDEGGPASDRDNPLSQAHPRSQAALAPAASSALYTRRK